MKHIILYSVMAMACWLATGGCLKVIDPVTGHAQYAVGPKADKIINTTGQLAAAAQQVVTPAVTAVNPVAGGIMGLLLGIAGSLYGTYKRWRKPLTTLSDKYDRVSLGLKAAADVIDTVVKPQAEAWNKAKPILRQAQRNGAINGDMVNN